MDSVVVGGTMRRPFSSWRTPCREGVSSLGYFADLVLEARHSSPTVYLKELGLNGRNIDPREVLSSLLLLPLRAEDREALDRASAITSQKRVMLAGQCLRPRQWSITRRRWCPACLAESDHHRTWWDVLPYQNCHLHGCPIEDLDEDALPVEWWWASMSESPRGHRLARTMPRLAAMPSTLSSYLVGRLGYAEAIHASILDGAPLGEAIAFVRFFGRMLASSNPAIDSLSPVPGNVDEALSLCLGDESPLIEAVAAWLLERVPEHDRGRGLTCFGRFWGSVFDLRDAGLRRTALWILKTALSSVGYARGAGNTPFRRIGRRAEIGLHELAKELGHDHKGVLNVAQRIGAMPSRHWYRARLSFGEADVAAITSAFGRLMTHAAAAKALRLRPADFGKLVAAGTIEPLLDASRGSKRGRRFLVEDVEALRTRLAAGDPVPGLPERRRSPGTSVARLTSVAAIEPGDTRPIGLCGAEVEVELGISWETVTELEALGYLRRLPDSNVRGTPSLIDGASVAATADRLASARVYQDVIGATAAQIVKRLREYGVAPVVEPRPGGRVTPMFDRVEVRAALGLERDPDDFAADRGSSLWIALRRRLLQVCPCLKCPTQMPSDAFTVYIASRKVMFAVRVDRALGSVSFVVPISRLGSARRWEFFQFNRDAILALSDYVAWEESLNAVEGTIVVRNEADIDAAAPVFKPLIELLGGSAGGKKPGIRQTTGRGAGIRADAVTSRVRSVASSLPEP